MGIENEYEGKIILVTGGAGCIGTNLCRKLAELNANFSFTKKPLLKKENEIFSYKEKLYQKK